MVISCSCWCYDLSWVSKNWIQFPFSLATLAQKAEDSLEQRRNFLPVPGNGQPGEVHIIFAVLQLELLSGGVMKGKCESLRVSVKHSHQSHFRQKFYQARELSGFRWALERHPDPLLTRQIKMGCQLVTVQREDKPCILNITLTAFPSVVGWRICQKNRPRFSISHTGLFLPPVSDLLYSEMPSKYDYEAEEPIWESAKLSVMLSVHPVTPALAMSFPLDREMREGQVEMSRAHTDISHFPIISPLSPHFWERGNFKKRFYQAHQRGKEKDLKV